MFIFQYYLYFLPVNSPATFETPDIRQKEDKPSANILKENHDDETEETERNKSQYHFFMFINKHKELQEIFLKSCSPLIYLSVLLSLYGI